MRIICLFLLSIAVTMLSLGCAADVETNLVAYYPFDEGSGSTLRDTSGSGNNGIIRDAKWVRCADGYALEFDGIKSFVDCGNTPSLDIRGPITICAWILPSGRQTGREVGVIGKQFSSYVATLYGNDTL